jgi:hypothetical protein
MKQIHPKNDMALMIGWNASGDGSMILHAWEEGSEQSQIVCQPHHLQDAFEELARLTKRAVDGASRQAQIYSELIELLVELRGLQESPRN